MHQFGPDVTLNNPAFIHPSAQIYGKVTINEGASVWINAAIRSENFEVVIGEYSNVQDFVLMHVGASTGTYVGRHCSLTHHTTIHGCTIGDNCLIGINATIMDGCVIGDNCIIGGHAFLKEGTVIPDNSVVTGIPGTVSRRRNNYVQARFNAFVYYQNALAYALGNHRRWDEPSFIELSRQEMNRLQAELRQMQDNEETT